MIVVGQQWACVRVGDVYEKKDYGYGVVMVPQCERRNAYVRRCEVVVGRTEQSPDEVAVDARKRPAGWGNWREAMVIGNPL